MSATVHTGTYVVVIRDADQLPGDVDADDVMLLVSAVVSQALRDWYERRGRRYLACPP